MKRMMAMIAAASALAACEYQSAPEVPANQQAAPAAATPAGLKLSRLECGSIRIKNYDEFFSDRPGLYPSGPRDITDSCYLIQHGDQHMLWDTGLWPDLIGKPLDAGPMVFSLDATIAEQLAKATLKPEDIDVVGISHHHEDHTGQAAMFPQARLIVGAGDFEKAKAKPQQGGPSPITPWLKDGAQVTKATVDIDVFGDGSVVVIRLPGHTPDHLALLVKLKSGPVLLTGDLYHSTDARAKRGVPPFNTDRAQTLASMDKFEAMARALKAKVVIQHEPSDIKSVPAFPQGSE